MLTLVSLPNNRDSHRLGRKIVYDLYLEGLNLL